MRIAYCATVQPSYGGLKTFNVGLVKALFSKCQQAGIEFILITHEVHATSFEIPDAQIRTFSGNHFFYENFNLPLLLKRENVDYAIFPHNRVPVFFTGAKSDVVIIHDLLFWRFPEQFSGLKRLSRYLFMSMALRKADIVLSVSEFTKQELRAFGFQKPVSVCLEGVDPLPTNIKSYSGRNFPKDKPYFLFIGAHSFQKNIPALVEAFNALRSKGLDCRLILAGGKGSEANLVDEKCRESPFIEDIIRPGFVSEEEKLELLKNAEAFVFPSIYEGFGIPILEAFQIGCPVICSNKASLPEVAGEAALLCSSDFSGIESAMVQVLKDPGLKNNLREKGRIQLEHFEWENVAESVMKTMPEMK